MDSYKKINHKKMDILLLIISAFIYYKAYWGVYSLVVFEALELQLEVITVLDMIFIGVFVLSVVPCSFGLKYLFGKFLTK